MAAIGGIFDLDGVYRDTQTIVQMSRAMMARGGTQRGAYINGCVALFSGLGRRDGGYLSYHQPAVCRRERGTIVTALDGDPCLSELFDGERCEYFSEDKAAAIGESYRSCGVGFADRLSGGFAIAISDEERGELILFRDRQGRRPLFWTREDRRIAFASEIKGLMRFMSGSAAVDTGRLREHIFSPYGACGAEMIYRDVHSIPRGSGCVCSKLGMSPFTYCDAGSEEAIRTPKNVLEERIVTPEQDEMRRLLAEILFAFDYPQFDVFMPSFLERLREASRESVRRTLTLEDGTLCMDIGYSNERCDRLCSMSGIDARCVPPRDFLLKDRELRKMEKTMRRILAESDTSVLCRLFGENWDEQVSKEKNTAKRIRIEGMLYQTVVWCDVYNLIFV